MIELVTNLGALLTLGLGLMALISPSTAASFTSIQPVGKTGTSEIRATYGGLFIGLGGCALYLQMPIVFLVVGFAWMAAATGRLISVIIDRNVELVNLGGIVFEAGIGSLLVAGHIARML